MNIIIATHGKFGEELKNSAEMILGNLENVYSISLLPEQSFEDFMNQADSLLKKMSGTTIALVDLFGGTPSNVLTVLTRKYEHHVIAGLSMPLFIEVYMSKDQQSDTEVMQQFIASAQQAIVYTNQVVEED
ncbi:PTS system, D-glucosaminate-specific IIA component [Enterococcus sp. DIV0755f]|uniref:PTS sugar transporter subunit IIA n=1 Tax=Enterococcus TaxID=1350 RepID=UPI003D0D44B3